jgi:urea transporter
VFGLNPDEPLPYYVDIFLGALSALSLLIGVTLLLDRRPSWALLAATLAFSICILLAHKKRAVAAGAFLFVAIRFAFALLITFQMTALAGMVLCVLAAAMVLGLMKNPGRS